MTGRKMFFVAATLCIAAVGGCNRADPPRAARQSPPAFGGDFTLRNHDNQPFRLADVRGRPVLLFFGYTSCPDMCPVTRAPHVGRLNREGDAGRFYGGEGYV